MSVVKIFFIFFTYVWVLGTAVVLALNVRQLRLDTQSNKQWILTGVASGALFSACVTHVVSYGLLFI